MAEVKIIQCLSCGRVTRLQGNENPCVWCGELNTYIEGMSVFSDSGKCEKCNNPVDGLCKVCKPNSSYYASFVSPKREMFIGPYITWDQFNKDILDFSDSLKGKGYDAIIGVPRSGLVVASQMSIRMGLPLYSIGEYGPISLSGGLRVRRRQSSEKHEKAILVEDSTASGHSLSEAEKWMDSLMDEWNVHKCAVYSTKAQTSNLSHWHRELELPHWFEWNLIWNQVLMSDLKVGVDFDGILCPDFTSEQDDDGWRYLDAMKRQRCCVPSGTHIHAIITARLEKYRKVTDEWLVKHGISYRHLIMGHWDTKEDREKDCVATYKTFHCNRLDVGMFIESCPEQAKIIKSKRIHPVLCPALGGSISR